MLLPTVRPALAAVLAPALAKSAVCCQQRAGMATLKEIQMRLKSITNISKITKSMKMIASTKVQRAQRTLESSRALHLATKNFCSTIGAPPLSSKPELIVVVSSDRGLCGGIHSTLSRTTRKMLRGDFAYPAPPKEMANPGEAQPAPAISESGSDDTATSRGPRETSLVIIGDKARTQLSRDAKKSIAVSFNQCAKNGPTFQEAILIADNILANERTADYRSAAIVYNRFKSAISYETKVIQLLPAPVFTALGSPSLQILEADDEVLRHFYEFQLATNVFYCIAEGYASEITARRTAMDNATKNAGDIINRLTMSYNRQRQAAITNDLVDIITGASAV